MWLIWGEAKVQKRGYFGSVFGAFLPHSLGADLEPMYCWEQTFLHFAALTGNWPTINILRLLEVTCKAHNSMNTGGYTAMEIFQERMKEEHVQLMADQHKPMRTESESFCSLIEDVQTMYLGLLGPRAQRITCRIPFKRERCDCLSLLLPTRTVEPWKGYWVR